MQGTEEIFHESNLLRAFYCKRVEYDLFLKVYFKFYLDLFIIYLEQTFLDRNEKINTFATLYLAYLTVIDIT